MAGAVIGAVKGKPKIAELPVDVVALEEFLGGPDVAAVNELLAVFVEAAWISLTSLKAARIQGRFDGLRAIAHGGMGEARCAAAVYLGELYAELERQVKAGEFLAVEVMTARIGREVARVARFVAERRQQAAA